MARNHTSYRIFFRTGFEGWGYHMDATRDVEVMAAAGEAGLAAVAADWERLGGDVALAEMAAASDVALAEICEASDGRNPFDGIDFQDYFDGH